MSNIIVDYNATIQDGTELVFRSPVDCSQITGLKVNYSGGSKEFMFADAHGNDVGDIDHLFAENVVVKVILDVTSGMAFVQNPDTNSYLEYRFGMLADSIVGEATGSKITLADSSNRNLQGLKIYGNYTEENGVVGENGSVTVNVSGKNLADVQKFSADSKINTPTSATVLSNSHGTTISATTGDSIVVTQSKAPSTGVGAYQNGFFCVGFYCPLKVGDVVTISFDFEVTANLTNRSVMIGFLNAVGLDQSRTTSTRRTFTTTITENTASSADNWNYFEIRVDGKSGVFSNFQIEYGTTYTGHEEYKGLQTITVPTPNGLDATGGRYDEIDFAKGVYIKRVGLDSGAEETPLPDEVLAAYAKLHTYKPNTVITNDYGAEMDVEYVADTKTYIDNKFTELQNAILSAGANV